VDVRTVLSLFTIMVVHVVVRLVSLTAWQRLDQLYPLSVVGGSRVRITAAVAARVGVDVDHCLARLSW
jgi:hypothetical protein